MPLRRDRQPYRDYQLAKRFAWDAQTIDLIQDQADWQKLTPVEREFMKHLLALFVVFLNDHLIVEGVLAETGDQAVFTACRRNGVLPGLAQGMGNVKRDESRHIAY